MIITYTEDKNFIPQQVLDFLICSLVQKYSDRLEKVLINFSYVIRWKQVFIVGFCLIKGQRDIYSIE